jgi:hypothetical protein
VEQPEDLLDVRIDQVERDALAAVDDLIGEDALALEARGRARRALALLPISPEPEE